MACTAERPDLPDHDQQRLLTCPVEAAPVCGIRSCIGALGSVDLRRSEQRPQSSSQAIRQSGGLPTYSYRSVTA